MSVVIDAAKQLLDAWDRGGENIEDAIAILRATVKAEEEAPFPSMREELTRKTLEAVEWITAQSENGRLGNPALGAATHAVWMVVSGLVDRDIHEILSELSAQFPSRASRSVNVLIKGDRFVRLVQSGEKMVVFRGKTGTSATVWENKKALFDTPGEAFERRSGMVKALRGKGFTQLV